jgi:hypothetical protein
MDDALPVFNVSEFFEFSVEAVNEVVPAVRLLGELLGVRVQTFGFGVQLFLKRKKLKCTTI